MPAARLLKRRSRLRCSDVRIRATAHKKLPAIRRAPLRLGMQYHVVAAFKVDRRANNTGNVFAKSRKVFRANKSPLPVAAIVQLASPIILSCVFWVKAKTRTCEIPRLDHGSMVRFLSRRLISFKIATPQLPVRRVFRFSRQAAFSSFLESPSTSYQPEHNYRVARSTAFASRSLAPPQP